MSKPKDPHRKVKVDYSVLQELLGVYLHCDGTYTWDMYDDKPFCMRFDKKIIKKAENIINNS